MGLIELVELKYVTDITTFTTAYRGTKLMHQLKIFLQPTAINRAVTRDTTKMLRCNSNI